MTAAARLVVGERWPTALLAAVPQRQPTQWVPALLLTALVLAVAVGGWLLMLRGWRRRKARQGDVELPAPPTTSGAQRLPPLSGLYVGTVTAGDWLDRVAAHGLGFRAPGVLRYDDAGVTVERDGELPFLIPLEALREVRLAQALAGKVVGPGGLLVVTWDLEGRALDTGFRAQDPGAHVIWASTLAGHGRPTAGQGTAAGAVGEG